MHNITSYVKEIIEGKGFVVIPEVLSATQAQEARSNVLQLLDAERQQGKLLIDGKRERLYGLIYKGKIFELMVQHPRVIEIIEAIVGEDMTLSGFSTHILNPGATSMGVHVDYPYWTMKLPFPSSPVMNVQVIWMVEDFTENNGSPIFAPHSQKLCRPPESEKFAQVAEKATGKAGSVVISHGLCWHDTSVNSSEKPRVSILANYTPKFVRSMLNPSRDLRQEVIDRASSKLKQLLGYEFQSAIVSDVKRIREKGWN